AARETPNRRATSARVRPGSDAKAAAYCSARERCMTSRSRCRSPRSVSKFCVNLQVRAPPTTGSQFLSGYVVSRVYGASSLCTFSARVYCVGTAPSEGSAQTSAKQLRRQSRVDAIEHARVLVPHRRRAELVRNAVRAQPGRVGAPQIVGRAARDAGAGAGTLQRLPELRPRQGDCGKASGRVARCALENQV